MYPFSFRKVWRSVFFKIFLSLWEGNAVLILLVIGVFKSKEISITLWSEVPSSLPVNRFGFWMPLLRKKSMVLVPLVPEGLACMLDMRSSFFIKFYISK